MQKAFWIWKEFLLWQQQTSSTPPPSRRTSKRQFRTGFSTASRTGTAAMTAGSNGAKRSTSLTLTTISPVRRDRSVSRSRQMLFKLCKKDSSLHVLRSCGAEIIYCTVVDAVLCEGVLDRRSALLVFVHNEKLRLFSRLAIFFSSFASLSAIEVVAISSPPFWNLCRAYT